jgi:FkbM family methyltransferase
MQYLLKLIWSRFDYYAARLELSLASLCIDRAAARRWIWQDLIGSAPHLLSEKFGHRENISFLFFCMLKRERAHAQLLQDLWVLYELREKRSGFFVEFGAADGIRLSNTYLLEKSYGWSGILAEPLPKWHSTLIENRSAAVDRRCVWTSTGERIEFLNMDEDDLSTAKQYSDTIRARHATVKNSLLIDTVSLNDLLSTHKAPRDIDFMSIDTEGSELEILRSFDFSRFNVNLIAVEHNNDKAKRRAICNLLNSHGYQRRFEAFSLWDDWYRRLSYLR